MALKVWQEQVTIPTYEVGTPEKNPIFLEKRVYQGSSGKVYPNPVIEKIYDEKIDKQWDAIYMENDYIKVMILPALGGRVQMAYDKIKQRHFVYYNNVIKPALVGLTGPWISGGIEFNWPQHHRPSTYEATDYKIEENADGSITAWCSEVEKMFGQKGMQGFTLHPDKAYLEIKVKLYNRTALPQTFLWWANPAVVVNDGYQSVFPPDVWGVYDHGKRDSSRFPIATGTYYKMDYSAGVDISRYKNIPVPTSYMAVKSDYCFMGGYENDAKGGILHVADRNVSPGKKQWTWGHSDFGQAWDRNLTDEDGPYIEIMCGVYTDNQPDFTWLMPNEQKTFTQYFMPYQELGLVKNASKDCLLTMDFEAEKAPFKVYVTGKHEGLTVNVKHQGKVVYTKVVDMTPEVVFEDVAPLAAGYDKLDVTIEVLDKNGMELVSWTPDPEEIHPTPPPATKAPEPEDIKTNEELYLHGMHLEQIRHATYNPMAYYEEALRRDKTDIRCNNAKGLLLMRRGAFAEAETYLKAAYEKTILRNLNPYDGEPLYNLGTCQRLMGKNEEAYKNLYKATWNAAWKDSGYFNIAQISCMKGDYALALEHVQDAVERNWNSHKARSLKASLLRKLGKTEAALAWIEDSLAIDQFNMTARYEKYLLDNSAETLAELKAMLRGHVNSYLEFAIDYGNAGLYEEAIAFLNLIAEDKVEAQYPMVGYFMGYYAAQMGDLAKAKDYYAAAAQAPSTYCFPNKPEEIVVLRAAIAANPEDGMAKYYLSNLYYDKLQFTETTALWEGAAELLPEFPTVWRNLALAYYNKLDNKVKAQEVLEKAFEMDTTDYRILMELDQLYKKIQKSPEERLAFLEQYPAGIEERDDLYLEVVTLYNALGEYDKAYEMMMNRKFHPWEGGEGKVVGQYLLSLVEKAKGLLADNKAEAALELLAKTDSYPHNLGEGKLHGAAENDIHYWKGKAYQQLGLEEQAMQYFALATQGDSEPVQAFFYNDQQPDKILYQGLALRELGEEMPARSIFNKMKKHGEEHLFETVKIDYFAVSLPDLAIFDEDFNNRNLMHCHYIMGLSYYGLGDLALAKEHLKKVLELDRNHPGAKLHLAMC